MNESRKITLYSSTVFTSRELAAQRIEKFKARVLDPNNLFGITDKYPYTITINELEIVE